MLLVDLFNNVKQIVDHKVEKWYYKPLASRKDTTDKGLAILQKKIIWLLTFLYYML